jgi:hypothetical protein
MLSGSRQVIVLENRRGNGKLGFILSHAGAPSSH